MTPTGIEPATFRFVAHHLNHCATAVPGTRHITWKIIQNKMKCAALVKFCILGEQDGRYKCGISITVVELTLLQS